MIRSFFIAVFVLLKVLVFAQNEVVLTIGERNITLGEFERLYRKNSSMHLETEQTIDEYLDRFINFKLKVIEAQNLGLDTTTAFRDEFNMYRKELAKPYMTDSASLESLLRNAYRKLSKEVNASHILISLDPRALPADTMTAWNKIMNIRQAAITESDFATLAVEMSNDPSAKTKGGNLGWFTAFRMVHEFEEGAYSTTPGEISMPVRTRFGYHIIKVHDIRSARGSVQVAHIFIRAPDEMDENEANTVKEKIFAIKDSLNSGASFEQMVLTHSDDRNSANDGGRLPWFSTGMMIPEFENVAFALDHPGQVSDPVKSFYGWHLIKLLDKKPLGSYDEERADLVTRINSSQFSEIKQKAFINKLKADHNFQLNKENLQAFYTLVDSSVFSASWSSENLPEKRKKLFLLDSKEITMGDFAEWIEKRQKQMTPDNIQSYVDDEFTHFSDQVIYDYEESFLEEKYPEFKYIVEEYHDGILLFELTGKQVWDKAVQDTAGLESFFNANRRKYQWDQRAEAFIVTLDEPSMLHQSRTLTAKFGRKKKYDKEMLLSTLCPDDTTNSCMEVIYGKFEKGVNELIDKGEWKSGLGNTIEENGKFTFVYIRKILPPALKILDETRGLVISDYQEYLEKQWIEDLRQKYSVTINRKILSKIDPGI